jgi:putative transposase
LLRVFLRKYSRNKKLKEVGSVKLTINNPTDFSVDNEWNVSIPDVKLVFSIPKPYRERFQKINQIEFDSKYAFFSCTFEDKPEYKPSSWIGVDRNTTGHVAVAGSPSNSKAWVFGAKIPHIHQKYLGLRRNLQKKGLYRVVKKIRNRESRIVRDLTHKVSRSIVNLAKSQNAGIKIEWLRGIRNSSRWRSGRLHSWNPFQLERQVLYKSRLEGVPVTYVDARGTSKDCSRCGCVGLRQGNLFKCSNCGRVGNAHVNGAFNIAQRPSILTSALKMQSRRAGTDSAQRATR